MAANIGSTFLRITLGAELVRLRERAQLTGQQAAKAAGCSEGMISKVEAGTTGFRTLKQFMRLVSAYGISDQDEVALLVDWHQNAKGDDWWSPKAPLLPSSMPWFLGFESGAVKSSSWCPMVVQGLLQTQSYTESLMRAAKGPEDLTDDFIESAIAIRSGRKKRITEEGLELVWVTDESSLRKRVGSTKVMLEQYEELLRLVELPNVCMRIIPDDAPAYRVSSGNFYIMEFPPGSLPCPVVASDTVGTAVQVTSKERVVRKFSRRFDQLAHGALPEHAVPDFIHRISREARSS